MDIITSKLKVDEIVSFLDGKQFDKSQYCILTLNNGESLIFTNGKIMDNTLLSIFDCYKKKVELDEVSKIKIEVKQITGNQIGASFIFT